MIIIYTKDYSAVELNRIRVTRLYQHHLLTRPTSFNTSKTIVAIGLGIVEVAGIDPQRQVITLNANFELNWCDKLLRWNTSEQICLNRRNRSELLLNAREIWTPDIVAINGPGIAGKEDKYQYPVLAICTGNIRWIYKARLVSFCKIDVQKFPFDRQYCTIRLQSTIYDSSQLQLRSLYRVVRLYNFINTEWEILHATIDEIDLYSAHYAQNFSTIQINIELGRISRFYILKIIVPFTIISSLALFSFWLPTESGEKVALTVVVLLSLTIYLQIISDYVPKTERGFCILTLYSNTIFFLVFLSCIFNTVTVAIYYHEHYYCRNEKNKHTEETPGLFSMYESLQELSHQRWTFLKKKKNVQKESSKERDTNGPAILHDLRRIRKLLVNSHTGHNTVYFRSFPQRSVKEIAILLDRILFFIYLLSMPLTFCIMLRLSKQPQLSSATNQLLNLRKVASDPPPLYRGCPT